MLDRNKLIGKVALRHGHARDHLCEDFKRALLAGPFVVRYSRQPKNTDKDSRQDEDAVDFVKRDSDLRSNA